VIALVRIGGRSKSLYQRFVTLNIIADEKDGPIAEVVAIDSLGEPEDLGPEARRFQCRNSPKVPGRLMDQRIH
jgi:hypothetical protein